LPRRPLISLFSEFDSVIFGQMFGSGFFSFCVCVCARADASLDPLQRGIPLVRRRSLDPATD
jgi:hypothetical protein